MPSATEEEEHHQPQRATLNATSHRGRAPLNATSHKGRATLISTSHRGRATQNAISYIRKATKGAIIHIGMAQQNTIIYIGMALQNTISHNRGGPTEYHQPQEKSHADIIDLAVEAPQNIISHTRNTTQNVVSYR